MTEQQPYSVVRRFRDFEVRDYPASAVAEVMITDSFEQAGTRAFGPLFGYISGRNLGRQSISMTAPVLQRTAADGGQAVSFVLPATLSANAAPAPDDDAISIEGRPATRTAAMTYSGRWSRSAFEQHRDLLIGALDREGLRAAGEARFARYNPPFTPWFLRRNEVLIDVEDA